MCDDRRQPRCRALAGLLSLLLLLVGGVACDTGQDRSRRPLGARLDLEVPEEIAPREPFPVQYRWVPGDGYAPPSGEGHVFVHVVAPDGTILKGDDHRPPVPFEEWAPGEPVSYRRWVYLVKPAAGAYLDVRVGVYDREGRYLVAGGDARARDDGSGESRPAGTGESGVEGSSGAGSGDAGELVEVLERRIRVALEDPDAVPRYESGWHPVTVGWKEGRRARWTRGRAVASFPNPRKPAVLYLRGYSSAALLGEPQRLTLSIDGERVHRTRSRSLRQPVEVRVPVDAETLGSGDRVRVTIDVEPPHGEYGMQVHRLYLATRRLPSTDPADRVDAGRPPSGNPTDELDARNLPSDGPADPPTVPYADRRRAPASAPAVAPGEEGCGR